MPGHRALLCLLIASGCGAREVPAPAPAPDEIVRVELAGEHRGLSGLAITDDQRLWAVSERGHTLVSFAADGSDQRVVTIEGVPDGVDLESLAWLGGNQFAVGTERGGDGRADDAILILEVDLARATIVSRRVVELAALGIEARDNQGLEGLCAARGLLIAAVETPIARNGGRAARLVALPVDGGAAINLTLVLTSETGKISALDCRPRGDDIEVLAVERHFEVTRVLRFDVEGSPRADTVIHPTIALDLSRSRRPSENHEGIVFAPGGQAWMILDNDYGGERGANQLHRVVLEPR